MDNVYGYYGQDSVNFMPSVQRGQVNVFPSTRTRIPRSVSNPDAGQEHHIQGVYHLMSPSDQLCAETTENLAASFDRVDVVPVLYFNAKQGTKPLGFDEFVNHFSGYGHVYVHLPIVCAPPASVAPAAGTSPAQAQNPMGNTGNIFSSILSLLGSSGAGAGGPQQDQNLGQNLMQAFQALPQAVAQAPRVPLKRPAPGPQRVAPVMRQNQRQESIRPGSNDLRRPMASLDDWPLEEPDEEVVDLHRDQADYFRE